MAGAEKAPGAPPARSSHEMRVCLAKRTRRGRVGQVNVPSGDRRTTPRGLLRSRGVGPGRPDEVVWCVAVAEKAIGYVGVAARHESPTMCAFAPGNAQVVGGKGCPGPVVLARRGAGAGTKWCIPRGVGTGCDTRVMD